jgi:hypothetical protein
VVTAVLITAALLTGLLFGAWAKASARSQAGVAAGRAAVELEHGWQPTPAEERLRLRSRRSGWHLVNRQHHTPPLHRPVL